MNVESGRCLAPDFRCTRIASALRKAVDCSTVIFRWQTGALCRQPTNRHPAPLSISGRC
jgi:hypothetical protein